MATIQTLYDVQQVDEIASIGANLERRMTPLDLVSFLRSSYTACEGSDASEAAVKGALGFISKLMTSARSDGEDFMFSAAEREKAEVSYGTLAWIVFARLLRMLPTPSFVPSKEFCGEIFQKHIEITDMTVKDVIDAIDTLCIRWDAVAAERREFLGALEHRAAVLTTSIERGKLTFISHAFIMFRRQIWLGTVWQEREALFPPVEYSLEHLCERFIEAKDLRKKLLKMHFMLSVRVSDMARSQGSHTSESIVQAQRPAAAYHAAQTKAYKGTVTELLADAEYKTAVLLNAVDRFCKTRFDVEFISLFCYREADTVKQRVKLRAAKYPLICLGTEASVSLLIQQRQTAQIDIESAVFNWLTIIQNEFNGKLFQNIEIESPS